MSKNETSGFLGKPATKKIYSSFSLFFKLPEGFILQQEDDLKKKIEDLLVNRFLDLMAPNHDSVCKETKSRIKTRTNIQSWPEVDSGEIQLQIDNFVLTEDEIWDILKKFRESLLENPLNICCRYKANHDIPFSAWGVKF